MSQITAAALNTVIVTKTEASVFSLSTFVCLSPSPSACPIQFAGSFFTDCHEHQYDMLLFL